MSGSALFLITKTPSTPIHLAGFLTNKSKSFLQSQKMIPKNTINELYNFLTNHKVVDEKFHIWIFPEVK